MTRCRHRRAPWGVAAGLVLATAACSGPSAPLRSTSTTTAAGATSETTGTPATGATPSTTAAADVPPAGTYLDAPQGEPHYVLDLTASSSTSLVGSVAFVFQDGRTSSPTQFSGTPSMGTARLTLEPGAQTVTATYTATTIVLESCSSYLQYASSADGCTFTLTPSTSPGSG